MLRLIKTASSLLAMLLVVFSASVSANSASEAEVARRTAWIQGQARPLDIERLAQSVSGARVVAIGESTHGTSEFQQFRSELSQELIARHGFDTIVIEATDAGVASLNKYIQGESEQVQPALSDTFYWIWQNEEFARIFADLRSFNLRSLGSASHRQLTLRGMDVFPGGATRARLKDVLSRHRKDLSAELEALEQNVFSSNDPGQRKIATDAIRKFLSDLTANLASEKLGEADRVALTSSANDLASFYSYIASGIPDQVVRDRAMAENVQRLVESGHRVIVWVHNGHVANADGSFGSFVKQQYGSDYVAIGLTTLAGTYSGLEPANNKVGVFPLIEPPAHSLESYLNKTGYATAYLDLRTKKARSIPQWLREPMPCRPDIGFYEQPDQQADDVCTYSPRFDIMVFFRKTSETTPFAIWPDGVPLFD